MELSALMVYRKQVLSAVSYLLMWWGAALHMDTADASTVSRFTGRFEFYDEAGVLQFEDPNISGIFDIPNSEGFFESGIDFRGSPWRADLVAMYQWDGVPGSGTSETNVFSWVTETWQRDGQAITCKISGALDGCIDLRDSGAKKISSRDYSYTFRLQETQFAGVVFIDWAEYRDIVVLSAMQVLDFADDILTVGSIDTDMDGIPGSALVEAPFAGSTWSFDGQQDFSIVPLPAAVWLFVSGGLGMFLSARVGRRVPGG